MYNIAICDDTARELMGIRDSFTAYRKNRPGIPELEVDVFSKPEDLLEACAKTKYNLLLLDILMPEKNGIETAAEIKRMNPDVSIIYISTTAEFAMDAFSVNAVSYLLKPYTAEQFDEAMDRVFRELEGVKTEAIPIRNLSGSLMSVDVNDMLYIESREKVIRIVMNSSDDILTRSSLTSIYEHFSKYPNIVKCGGSYILNLIGIRNFDSKSVIMNDGTAIPVPRRVLPELKKKFIDYYES